MSQPGKNSAKTALEKFIGADHTEPEEKAPSITNADLYIEEEPTVGEFLREITPSARAVGEYFYNLFPFLSWVGKYNLIWFIGDLVAGKSTPRCGFILGETLFADINSPQVSLLVLSSFPSLWPMPSWHSFPSNMDCTHPSWVS